MSIIVLVYEGKIQPNIPRIIPIMILSLLFALAVVLAIKSSQTSHFRNNLVRILLSRTKSLKQYQNNCL